MTHNPMTLYYGFTPAQSNNPVKKTGMFEIGAVDRAGTSIHVEFVKGWREVNARCAELNIDLDKRNHS